MTHPDGAARGAWNILLVEEDPALRAQFVELIEPIVIEERAIRLLHADTIDRARALLTDDTITMGLFSVEMDDDPQAGVALTRHLRETIGNYAIRVVLASRQPMWALEERVVIDYDISDYRSKQELLGPRLFPLIRSSLRSYAQMVERIDALTGQSMRQGFIRQATREMARAERYGTSLAFLFIDVDDFIALNERFGRDAGDEVLRRLGGLMSGHFRSSDTMARLRGDKFVAMLPSIEVAEAVMVAERLRLLAEALRFDRYPGLTVTLSIGVSLYADGDTVESLLERADAAMSSAKARGRNCVVAITDGPDIDTAW